MAFDKKKFLNRFIEEARKHIAQLSSGLLSLESSPGDSDLIDTIFRGAHTIKGSSNMLNLTDISKFAHTIENRLSLIREGELHVDSSQIDLLLKAVDHLSLMIDVTEKEQPLPQPDDKLTTALSTVPVQQDDEEPAAVQVAPDDDKTADERRKNARLDNASLLIKTKKLDTLIQLVTGVSTLSQSLGESYQQMQVTNKLIKKLQLASRENRLPPQILQLISELQEYTETTTTGFSQNAIATENLNTELRDVLFSLRLIPVSMIFEKFPRLVREMASKFNKKISFTMSGADTELDKKIVDMIDESLVQIIRNAIDHGIETIDDRLQLGKPGEGNIHLKASYEHGMCVISITDDGAGIHIDKLLEKAISKNMLDENAAEIIRRSPNSDVLCDLIFTPGLSTSDIITDISGRGVGMDIVQDNIISRLNGAISIETARDKGTTFQITLPINTAIMNVTKIRIGNTVIALPSYALQEIVQVEAAEIIQVVNRTAINLREQIIPIIHLEDILQQRGTNEERPFFLIVRSGTGAVAILADDVIAQENCLIHSLPIHIQETPWVSGCIIAGNYSVINLLNTRKLIKLSQKEYRLEKRDVAPNASTSRILVADDSISTRDIEKSILESHGYTVDVAVDGQNAWEMAQETKYALIVTDIEMPNMDGFTLTERLRAHKEYRQTPIILVSSRDREADKLRGISAGADAYIVKASFNQENLIQTIRSLIG